ncbi:hypothetical protein BJY00DRAFT_312059 [Aspergillus carlsbadensis]|nr:hypothetical protein BJY00DRAFT_312059 [Aspergillus carlsbadensis]
MPTASHHKGRFYRRQGLAQQRSASLDIPEYSTPTLSRISIAISPPDSPSISGSGSGSGSGSSIHTLDRTARTSTRRAVSTLTSPSTSNSSAMYRTPGTSPTRSTITTPDHNDLPTPYLNLVDFPSTTTLPLHPTAVPDGRPSLPPRPTSLTTESRPPLPPRPPPKPKAPRGRQSLSSLSSISLSNMRPPSHSYSQSQSTYASTSTSGSESTTSTTSTSTTTKSPTNPTPSKPTKKKLPLPPLHPSAPPSPASDLLTLTRHIETQTSQARHLFSLKQPLLDATCQSWISSTIRDTEAATRDVAVLTEGLRVEQATNQGRLGVTTQIRWMVRDSRRAREKRERLVIVHRSLMAVLGLLQGVRGPVEMGVVGEVGSIGNGGRERNAEEGGGFQLENGEQIRRPRRMTVDKGPTISSAPMKRVEEDAPWDLSVQLQDAGMEAVVPNMVAEKVGVSSTTKPAENVSSAPSTKMDDELMDMLSWRWAQGRASS